MNKLAKKLICMLVVVFLIASLATGCGSSQSGKDSGAKDTSADSGKELPLLEYSVDLEVTEKASTLDNPNDVVTPYLEKRFNIKVKDIILGADQTIGFKERFGTYAAANNIPDVIIGGGELNFAVSTGKFADLTQYIDEMESYNKYFDAKYWPRYMNDGKKYQIPLIIPNMSNYKDDPYAKANSSWSMWVREDILAQAGYKFTPVAEIEKNTTLQGKMPTLEDFEIEPAIDTPDKFLEMLRKIKALNIKVGDKSLIPLSIVSWSQFHFGNMFDFGHWRIDDQGNVDGFLGSPGAKSWYKMLSTMYREGLIDNDFIGQKDDQLQQKVASGRVACGMYVPDLVGAENAIKQVVPNASIRYITWPKETPGYGAFDLNEGGFWRLIIKKDFKDIKRLTEYFDWMYSDEGFDILTWGPESAGLWEIKDGKKVFKDKEVEQDCLSGVLGKKGADYYGLYNCKTDSSFAFMSKAAICAPVISGYNPKSYTRSYPPVIDIQAVNMSLCGINGVDYSGRYSYGDGGLNAEATASWYWSKFVSDKMAKLLISKSDDDYDRIWDELYKESLKDGKYVEAKADMEKWFKENYKK